MATQSEIGSQPSGMARIAMLTGWLLAAGFCVWLEGTRILQLAATPAGILGWFAAWNIDTTLPALVLLALTGLWLLWPVPGRRQQARTEP